MYCFWRQKNIVFDRFQFPITNDAIYIFKSLVKKKRTCDCKCARNNNFLRVNYKLQSFILAYFKITNDWMTQKNNIDRNMIVFTFTYILPLYDCVHYFSAVPWFLCSLGGGRKQKIYIVHIRSLNISIKVEFLYLILFIERENATRRSSNTKLKLFWNTPNNTAFIFQWIDDK